MAVFYRYYDDGYTKDIAYLKAASMLVLIISFHLFTLNAVTGCVDYVFDEIRKLFEIDIYAQYTKAIVIILPLYLLITWYLPPRKVKEIVLTNSQYKKSIRNQFIYYIFSFLLFVIIIECYD